MRRRLWLALILVVGLGFRVSGLAWGLPNPSHPGYSYHPDEVFLVAWAQALAQGQIVIKQFQYGGTLYFSVLNVYRWIAQALAGHLGGINALADTLIVGRLCNVLISVLTLAVTAASARRLFDERAALASAAVLALCPAHAFLAQSVRPDEMSAFLVAVTIYLSSRRLTQPAEGTSFVPELISGAVIGAMIALRFPLGIFGLVPLMVIALRMRPTSWRDMLAMIRPAAALGIAAIFGYAVCSPHSLMYPQALRMGLQVQWQYQSSVFEDAVGRGPGLYQYGVSMLVEAMGWPLYALAVAGALRAAWGRSREDLLLLSAVLPYLLMTSNASWVVVRYTLPLLPGLALLIGSLSFPRTGSNARSATIWSATLIAALAFTLLPDLALRRAIMLPNSRDRVGAWVERHVPTGTEVVVFQQYDGDVFFLPTLPGTVNERVFPLQGDIDPAALTQARPAPLLLLGEDVYANMDRLGANHPKKRIAELALLFSTPGRFRIAQRFDPDIRMLGMDFSSWFQSQDYQIIQPGFRLYERMDEPSRIVP